METRQGPQAFADTLNGIFGFAEVQPGTSANGWFGGYGCRWCPASRAWFTVLPFDMVEAAAAVAELFRAGGVTVTVTDEAGITREEGGRGVQVSAYVRSARGARS